MKWRFIPTQTYPAKINMAIDEVILEKIAQGASPPTVRFYRWRPSAVSIGRFQRIREVVDIDKCRKLGIDVVRRITGGGAVYHDYNGEITYSVLAPEELLPRDITKSYREICGWIARSLETLGIESSFQPINDIIVDGKKISGNAQTRRKGVVLQHGTILYDLNLEVMFSVLRISQEKISDKLIKKIEERVTSITRIVDVDYSEVVKALWEGFSYGKDVYRGELNEKEISRAEELAEKKYSNEEWTFLR